MFSKRIVISTTDNDKVKDTIHTNRYFILNKLQLAAAPCIEHSTQGQGIPSLQDQCRTLLKRLYGVLVSFLVQRGWECLPCFSSP